jgi:hypothetical protein
MPDPTVHRDGPGYRDTATGLGRLLPGPSASVGTASCPGCHRLADVVDLYRKAERISDAEIRALRTEVETLRNRYERTTP